MACHTPFMRLNKNDYNPQQQKKNMVCFDTPKVKRFAQKLFISTGRVLEPGIPPSQEYHLDFKIRQILDFPIWAPKIGSDAILRHIQHFEPGTLPWFHLILSRRGGGLLATIPLILLLQKVFEVGGVLRRKTLQKW